MTDKFSWNRFFRFARAEQAGERREMLLKLGGFAAFSIVMYLLCNRTLMPMVIVVMGAVFLIFLNISSSFKRYFSPGEASQMLMLPVAKSEKFLYVMLKNLVVIPLLLIGFILLNDIILANILGFDSWIQFLPVNMEWFQYVPEDKYWIEVCLSILYIMSWVSGLFGWFLGAVFFRRRQLVYTFLSSFLIYSLVTFNPFIMVLISNNWLAIWTDNTNEILIGLVILILVWTAGLMYLTWRRYSTLQITK